MHSTYTSSAYLSFDALGFAGVFGVFVCGFLVPGVRDDAAAAGGGETSVSPTSVPR